jgi:hypothetical protein
VLIKTEFEKIKKRIYANTIQNLCKYKYRISANKQTEFVQIKKEYAQIKTEYVQINRIRVNKKVNFVHIQNGICANK